MGLAAGDKLDRYTLLEKLGGGGQGAVWKARDPLDPELPKAVKVLSLRKAADVDVERIRREARALAKLSHASLVKCHALFEDVQQDCLGLVLDLVDGTSLLEVAEDTAMTLRHRECVLEHIASALSYLHTNDVIHRDLKMSNVIVDKEFWASPQEAVHIRLVDFGIAVKFGNPEPLTSAGSVVGTVPYLPPEAIAPGVFGAAAANPSVDLFSFGVLAWGLLTGQHPGGDVSGSVQAYVRLYQAAADEEMAWPRVPLDHRWADVLRKCLRLYAQERWPDAATMLEALRDGGDEDVGSVNAADGKRSPPHDADVDVRNEAERPTVRERPIASRDDDTARVQATDSHPPPTHARRVGDLPTFKSRLAPELHAKAPVPNIEVEDAADEVVEQQGEDSTNTWVSAIVICLVAAGLTALVVAAL